MKICLLATTFPRFKEDFTGPWLIGLSRALVEAGAQVTVIAPHDKDTPSHEVWNGVEIRRFHYWWPKRAHGLCYGSGIPTNVRRKKWVALQLPTLEAGFLAAALRYGSDADILNAHWSFAGFPAAIAARLMKKPLVTSAYSAEYVPRYLNSVNKFIVNQSGAVVSISQYAHDMVERVVSPKRHRIVAFGVNAEKIAPAEFDVQRFRTDHGIAPDDFLVFAVGRLVPRKGYPVLIDAVEHLIKQGKRVRLLLAGRGPKREEYQARIDAAGIGERAQLLGFIPDEQLRYFLKAADVLVMPSHADKTGDTEGLGIPLLEAMANGTPVVGSDTGGIRDIVTSEVSGLLVPPLDPVALAEALERLRSDRTLQERLVENGYAVVNGPFSWHTTAQNTLNLFQEVCDDYAKT